MDRNIFLTLTVRNVPIVALRKESVDRNDVATLPEPSTPVALRKESVDRNLMLPIYLCSSGSRSPPGERG